MSIDRLKELVSQNRVWFEGTAHESESELAGYETTLGTPLPESIRWILSNHGYSHPCGVPSLNEAVRATLLCRDQLSLPVHYLILEDRGDAGIIVMNLDSGVVLWLGSYQVADLAIGEPVLESEYVFPDFAAWVEYCLEFEKDLANE